MRQADISVLADALQRLYPFTREGAWHYANVIDDLISSGTFPAAAPSDGWPCGVKQ